MKGYAAVILADGTEPIDAGYRRQPCEYQHDEDERWSIVRVTTPVTFGPFVKHGFLILEGAIFDLPLGGRELTPRLQFVPSFTTGPEPITTNAG